MAEPSETPDSPEAIRQGNISWAIGVVQGRVELLFPQPVQRIAMDAENARLIAEEIARCAYEARYGVKPNPMGSRLTEELRLRLVQKVASVAGNMARAGQNNLTIAQAVVDEILSEVI